MTKKPDKTAASDRLKAIATRLGLDDTRLAEYLGVSVSTLRHWTIGTRVHQPVTKGILIIQNIGPT